MTVKIGISADGSIKISTGSSKVRIENLEKWLKRNRDAILVKLEGNCDPSMKYKPGHVCQIESTDDQYSVFVGSHFIGQLPDEAISFAETIGYSPEFLVAIVGKVEDDNISIYIAE